MAASRRWFHPNISGQQAEKLLMEKGQEWSFLARPSSTEGAYTLSIRRNGEVTHIKIQNNGDSYDLYGGDTFATLSELVQHYMDNQDQLKEKNGAVIKLKYPMASVDPTPERWFHGHLSGREAERLLMEKGKNSSFLVRESQSKPGDFVISVRCDERVTHVKIRYQGNKYDVGGGEQFESLTELVEHYKKSPMVETSGTVVYIKHPLYNSRVLASSLEKRIHQLQSEDEDSQRSNNAFLEGFWGEFHQLQQSEFIGLRYQRAVGSKPENKAKNRYKNILPYDYTRVVLQDGDEETGTDYINANHISWSDDDALNDPKQKYVATQGPLNSTMLDFYRMIWQEGSRAIVNLARITERGKININIYWPTEEDKYEKVFVFEGKEKKDGEKEFICQYRVKGISETGDQSIIRREILLSKEDKNGVPMEEPRKIYQFHYMVWPDYNVPDDPGSMIDLLELINDQLESMSNTGPVVVHCSAGIGRTGTLIVTDMLISQVKAYGFDCDIDIFKTILMVRAQRSGLVQTQNQYQFVYLAIQRYMEVERQRQIAGQTGDGREYTNIKYATGAIEAAKKAQAAGPAPRPPVPPLPKASSRRRGPSIPNMHDVRILPPEDSSQQYQNINPADMIH